MAQLKLSGELVQKIQQQLEAEDEQARDPAVALQYLAGSIGYLLASVNVDPAEKREFHRHLCDFSEHVFEDMLNKQAPPQQEAFGIWRPGES